MGIFHQRIYGVPFARKLRLPLICSRVNGHSIIGIIVSVIGYVLESVLGIAFIFTLGLSMVIISSSIREVVFVGFGQTIYRPAIDAADWESIH